VIIETVRETGTGDASRVTPAGDYDGYSIAEAMKAVLHSDKPQPVPVPAWRRVLALVGLS
jgi:hypothetical protein